MLLIFRSAATTRWTTPPPEAEQYSDGSPYRGRGTRPYRPWVNRGRGAYQPQEGEGQEGQDGQCLFLYLMEVYDR